jgi:hypothetical protein
VTTQPWPTIEGTDLAIQQFAAAMESGARKVRCSETMVRTPVDSRHVEGINKNLRLWVRHKVTTQL